MKELNDKDIQRVAELSTQLAELTENNNISITATGVIKKTDVHFFDTESFEKMRNFLNVNITAIRRYGSKTIQCAFEHDNTEYFYLIRSKEGN